MISAIAVSCSLLVAALAVMIAGRAYRSAHRALVYLRHEIDRRSADGVSEVDVSAAVSDFGRGGALPHGNDAIFESSFAPAGGAADAELPALESMMGSRRWWELFGSYEQAELHELLDDVFASPTPDACVAPLLEVQSTAKVLTERCVTLTRGLVRVPMLCGVAAGLLVASLAQLSNAGLAQAASCVVGGVLASLLSQVLMLRARKQVRGYRELTDVLGRTMSTETMET